MAAAASQYRPGLQGLETLVTLPGMMRRVLPGMLGILFTLVCSLTAYGQHAGPEGGSLDQYIQNGGYAVKTLQGRIEGLNADTPFIPASTIKLVTCLAALHILGPDYRFATRFHVDEAGNLYIQSQGDPMLTSEDVAAIAGELYDQGVRRVNALILDNSAFALEDSVDGSESSARPYDAEITPLAINYNALPLLVRADRTVGSGEQQTPVLPIMQEIGKTLAPGRYRVNVGAFLSRGGLSNDERYAGELFQAQLRRKGIQTGDTILLGTAPDSAVLILTHESDSVRNIIRACLEYSNNFIANDLFIACGRVRFGGAGTWKKGRLALAEFTGSILNLDPQTISLVEGAGLSRKDLISPKTMISVLESFVPHLDLLPVKHGFLMKSGTMKGVYCYGGYFENHGRLVPFSIMLNQEVNNRDKILKLLAARFEPHPAPVPAEQSESR